MGLNISDISSTDSGGGISSPLRGASPQNKINNIVINDQNEQNVDSWSDGDYVNGAFYPSNNRFYNAPDGADRSVLYYVDPETGSSGTTTSLSSSMSNVGMLALDRNSGHILVLDQSENYSLYDIDGDSWVVDNSSWPLTGQIDETDMAVDETNGVFYVAGVGDGDNNVGTVASFEISSQSWTEIDTVSDLSNSRQALIYYDNALYIAGGYSGSNYINSVRKYDLSTNTYAGVVDIIPGAQYAEAYASYSTEIDGTLYFLFDRVYTGQYSEPRLYTFDPTSETIAEQISADYAVSDNSYARGHSIGLTTGGQAVYKESYNNKGTTGTFDFVDPNNLSFKDTVTKDSVILMVGNNTTTPVYSITNEKDIEPPHVAKQGEEITYFDDDIGVCMIKLSLQ